MRAVLRVAAAGRGNAAIVGIVITLSIVPSSRQSGIRAGIRWNVELSAVLRRAMVCMVMCAAIIVVAMVRASESGECARAVLLMCASAARDAHGAPASSVAQVAIARVSIPFVLVNGLFPAPLSKSSKSTGTGTHPYTFLHLFYVCKKM